MRKKANFEISEDITHQRNTLVNKVFEFELITPMFGGDAESWKIDIKQPVRSQSVKGQLRFWWRTMQSETDNKKLLYNENRIWGGKIAENTVENNRIKSKVKFSIIKQRVLDFSEFEANFNSKASFSGVKDDIIPGYVLFPIVPKVKENEKINYINKLTFRLQISFPKENENDVMNTLKLWTLFGGVGARTRRGTGSLYCAELLKNFNSASDIQSFLSEFDGSLNELLYPRVIGSTLAVQQQKGETDTQKVCKNLLERYGAYRQGPGEGRAKGSGHPGRSYWPEPDSIREIKGQYASGHEPIHPDKIWFPRAAFGLPIQTEFKNGGGDPSGKFMLEPDIGTGERWPSPVILKVVKLPNGNVYKTVLVLNQKFPAALKFDGQRLDNSVLPTNTNGKVMKTNDKLNGRTIYKHLLDFLKLEEVN